MTEDTIHRVACDVHDLAASCENDPVTRFALEGIANRLEAIEAAGGGALPKIEGAEPRRDWLELPRNITLKRFVMADRSVVFMGQYIQQGKQEPNDRPVRTYRIEVKRSVWGNRWRAAIYEDDYLAIHLECLPAGRFLAEYVAVKALRAWINRKIRNAAKNHRQQWAQLPYESEVAK